MLSRFVLQNSGGLVSHYTDWNLAQDTLTGYVRKMDTVPFKLDAIIFSHSWLFYNTSPKYLCSQKPISQAYTGVKKKKLNTFRPPIFFSCTLALFLGDIFKASCQPLGSCWAASPSGAWVILQRISLGSWWWKTPAVTNF